MTWPLSTAASVWGFWCKPAEVQTIHNCYPGQDTTPTHLLTAYNPTSILDTRMENYKDFKDNHNKAFECMQPKPAQRQWVNTVQTKNGKLKLIFQFLVTLVINETAQISSNLSVSQCDCVNEKLREKNNSYLILTQFILQKY